MDAAYTGNRISALRKEKGWTQRELADRLHVTDKAVSKWERGLNFPELSLLGPLSAVLGTTAADLLGLEAASDGALLEAASSLYQKEKKKLKKMLIACGCIFVGLGLAIFFCILMLEKEAISVVTVEDLAVWLAVLAVILFAVGFNILRTFANPVAVFWMGARSASPETMFGFFVKNPPNFADTPEGKPPQVPSRQSGQKEK